MSARPPLDAGPARRRSLLFAPGDDERKLAKAARSAADIVVADLEDAVAPGAKAAARRTTAAAVAGARRPVAVRVNLDDAADLELVRETRPVAVLVPKAAPEAAARAAAATGVPVLAMVETAEGLHRAAETAATPGVAGLCLGNLDLGAALRLQPRGDGTELLFARSQLVLASALAGLAAPVDGVHVILRDAAGLAEDAARARAVGMGGKLCIHPDQVGVVNEAFAPTGEELAWARRVLAAAAGGAAVVTVDGAMVDRPVVQRAREILALEASDTTA